MKNFLKEESGAALIIVLSFLMVIAVLTSTIVVISQLSARKIVVNVDREKAAYIAEGAAARMQWMIMVRKHSKEQQGGSAYGINNQNRNDDITGFANGKIRTLKYYDTDVEVYVADMASGYNINGFNPAYDLKSVLNNPVVLGGKTENFKTFLNRISDYVDRDNNSKPDGLESSGYASLGLEPLPRDNQMQYRDEALWIPGCSEFFKPDRFGLMSVFNIIPPMGLFFYSRSVNFYSAGRFVIMCKGGFSPEETDNILKKREEMLRAGSANIDGFFSPEIIKKFKKSFSFNDSGYYTLIIKASLGKGFAQRILAVSLKIGGSMNAGSQYYQYILF